MQSGAYSYDAAIDNVLRDLSRNGLGTIMYRSSAKRRLDNAVRNAVRTAVNKSDCKAHEENLELQGVNLVETTSHWGARATHAQWQGLRMELQTFLLSIFLRYQC